MGKSSDKINKVTYTYSPISNCQGGQLPLFQFFTMDFNLLTPPPPNLRK